MERFKVSAGIFIIIGFLVVAGFYIFVMSGIAEVHGTVQVSSSLVPWDESTPGSLDAEMLCVNGYCIKGPEMNNRVLLSTKNKVKSNEVKYSFKPTEGRRHLIVVYLQMDHLTGDVGQMKELYFMTHVIKNGKQKTNVNINFEKINSINSIIITLTGSDYNSPKIVKYPISKIPDIIKL